MQGHLHGTLQRGDRRVQETEKIFFTTLREDLFIKEVGQADLAKKKLREEGKMNSGGDKEGSKKIF